MRAIFGRQSDPRGGRHQDETRILVTGIVQRVLPALDERVVKRADRQQARAEERPGEAESGRI